MKYLAFNIVVIFSLAYLFLAPSSMPRVEKAGGETTSAGSPLNSDISVSEPVVTSSRSRQKAALDASEKELSEPNVVPSATDQKEALAEGTPETSRQHEKLQQDLGVPSRPKANLETRDKQIPTNASVPSNANRNVIAVAEGEQLMRPHVRRNELHKLAEEMELFFLNRTIR